MPKRITTAATLVLGAAAGAIMALAPIASTEPPPCNPDDVPCQQQQKPPDPAPSSVLQPIRPTRLSTRHRPPAPIRHQVRREACA